MLTEQTIASESPAGPAPPRSPSAMAPGGSRLPRVLATRERLVMLGLVALVLFFRKPEALLLPQLIADDAILFRDAWAEGLGMLLAPYAGYILVAPRLVAWLGTVLSPVGGIPLFYALASLASMLYVCWRLTSPRVTIAYAWVLALVVPLVPHDGEVFLNLCYIQWSLVLAAFALLAVRPATSVGEWIGDIVMLALVGLSGPFVLPLAPFLVVAALRERAPYRLAIASVAVATSIVQIAALATTGALGGTAAAGSLVSDGLVAVGTKLVAITFLGRMIPYDLPQLATAALGIALALLAAVAIAGLVRGRHRMLVVALLFAIAFYAVSAVVRLRHDPLDLVPFHHGDRYFYLPRILLVASLMLALAGRWRAIARGMLLLVALSAATTFRTDRPAHYDWRRWSGAIERGETTTIVVSPYHWTVEIPGRVR